MSDETISPPRIKITWLIGTLAAFGLFVVVGDYSRHMNRVYTDYDQERAAHRYETLAKVRHDENALLYPVDAQGHSTAEWVDQDKGTIRIPIDEAMAKEIDTLKSQVPGAGAEIPGAAPTPAPAPGAAPAAPAAKTPAPAKPAATPAPANKPAAKTNPSNT